MRLLLCTVIISAMAGTVVAKTVEPCDEKQGRLSMPMVTGFHGFFDKANRVEIRLLDADGSVTVAKNPVDLYLVVTNNGTPGDLQEHIWRLPLRVARVREVRRIRSGIVITGWQDFNPDTAAQRKVTATVTYHLRGSVLDRHLEIITR